MLWIGAHVMYDYTVKLTDVSYLRLNEFYNILDWTELHCTEMDSNGRKENQLKMTKRPNYLDYIN